MDSVFDTIFGLPVHILMVHAAVTLIPAAAAASVLLVVLPALPGRLRPSAPALRVAAVLVVLFDAAALALSWVAAESGERLVLRLSQLQTPDVAVHAERGDSMKWYALGLLVATVLYVLVRTRGALAALAAVLVVAAAVATTVWVIRVGHSGSSVRWAEVVENTTAP